MNQKKVGIILSYASEAIKILSTLIYTPIMLDLLGQNEYGLYQLVGSVVSYLGLLSLGFGSAYLRFYSIQEKSGIKDNVSRLNGMFLIVFTIITVISLLCGSFLVSNVRLVLGAKITDSEYSIAKVLMFLMVVNLSLTFPNSVFDSIITAHECFIFQKSITFVSSLCNPFLMVSVLVLGYGSIGMVTVTTIITFLTLIINIFYCFKKIHASFIFSHLQFGLLREMFAFTFFIFLNQIINQVNWTVGKFLLGRLVGTASVAIYGVAYQITTLFNQSSRIVSSVFLPKINRIVASSDDNSQLSSVFIRVGRMQFFVLALVLSGFIFFGKPFIFYWAGSEYSESYVIALLLTVPLIVPLIQNIGIEIQRAKNRHRIRSVVYFLMALINVIVSIPLIREFGATGAAIGTSLSLIFGNIIFMNWYYYKGIGLNIPEFWKNIINMCKGLLLPIFFGIVCVLIFDLYNIVIFIACIIIYSIIYLVSMFFIGINNDEKKLVIDTLNKIFHKK